MESNRKSLVCGGNCAVGSMRYLPGEPVEPGTNWRRVDPRRKRSVVCPKVKRVRWNWMKRR